MQSLVRVKHLRNDLYEFYFYILEPINVENGILLSTLARKLDVLQWYL